MTSQELPPGWAWTTLGEVAVVGSGATPKTKVPEYWGTEIAWVTPDDLSRNDSKWISSGRRGLSTKGYESCSARIVPTGSIVFSSRAPIGYVAIASGPLATNQGCKTATPMSLLDSSYLYWLLKHLTPEIESRASGSTFKEISARGLAATKIPLPPIAEQQRIVAALEDRLSRLDAADASATAAFLRANALDTALRNSSVSVTPDTEDLPSGWAWQSLGDLSNGSSYGTSTKCDVAADGAPVVRIPNIKSGQLDLSEMKYAIDHDLNLSKFFLGPGDLVIVRTNGSPALIGRTAVVRERTEMAFASYLIRFQLGSNELADWVQLVLSSTPWRRQIMKAAASSAGQYNLNQKFLKSLRIPVPPQSERKEILDDFADRASDVNRIGQVAPTVQARTAVLRRSLLRMAFNGELVDQDSDDETADIALAKILDQQSDTTPRRRPRATPVK